VVGTRGSGSCYLGAMDRVSIIDWANDTKDAIDLLVNAVSLAIDDTAMDDISLLGRAGNHLIDLADFVRSRVPAPLDPEQQMHWSQLVALVHALGMEITKTATLTFDITPTVPIMQQIGGEISALSDRRKAAIASV
jgi:hypothetical protein